MTPQRQAASLVSRSAQLAWRRLAVLTNQLPQHADSLNLDFSRGPGLPQAVPAEANSGHGGGSRIPFSATTAGAAAAAAAALGAAAYASQARESHCESAKEPALNPKDFVSFKLQHVEVLNHNTKVYRFALEPGQRLGLTVASCLVTKAPIGPPDESGKPKNVIRPYTPITQPHVEGCFDLLVKAYPNGVMSKHIASLKPGDTLEMKGPIPKLPYTPNMKKSIGMVAGGTGITPMLQVIDAVLANPDDVTQLSLVFANTSPADVLLKQTLEDYAAKHPNFKVFFVVDKASPGSDGWKGGVGFVTADMLRKALPPPSDDSLVLVCGPPGMMGHVSGDKAKDRSQGEVEGLLKQLGYTKDQVYKF